MLKWPSALLGLAFALLPGLALPAQEPQEIYQDFRGSRPLLPSLRLVGPLQDADITPEDAGLRIALPATRDQHFPVAIATTFVLSGDFEITATYELLSAKRPAKGYGVGVSLNVATSDAREKFTKVGRLFRPAEGSVYMVETWNKNPPKEWDGKPFHTEVRSGKLRLVREGELMRYLVADGPMAEFREIYRRKFGLEDLAHLNLEVCDSGAPGNPVEARFVDLKIRSSSALPAQQAAPVSDPDLPREQQPNTRPRGWLAGVLVLGLLAIVAVVLGIWLNGRRRRSENAGSN